MRSVFLFMLASGLVGCTSLPAKPTYYSISFVERSHKQYKFNVKAVQNYCQILKTKNTQGRILYRWPDFCGRPAIYASYELAVKSAKNTAQNTCLNGSVEMTGHKQIKEYAGHTGSSCYASVYNSVAYKTCSKSKPIYRHSTNIYFQCQLYTKDHDVAKNIF